MMRFRYSVRILVLLTVIVAAICYHFEQWRRRRFAEEQLCAIATPFDPDVNGYSKDPLFVQDHNCDPLRGLLVRCEFSDVEKHLVDAIFLEELILEGSNIDASRLSKVVATLPNLRKMEITECEIASIETISLRSATLASFVVSGSKFHGKKRILFDFPNLVSLHIADSNLESLNQFYLCKAIQELYVAASPGVMLTDADRAHLPELRRYVCNGVSHLENDSIEIRDVRSPKR